MRVRKHCGQSLLPSDDVRVPGLLLDRGLYGIAHATPIIAETA
jgi:hypothetical protein